MLSRRLISTLVALPLVCSQFAIADTNFDVLRPYKKRMMSEAIQLRITDRGMKKLEDQLLTIITAQGINPNDGYFNGTRWVSDKAYTTQDIEKMSPDAGRIVKKVRDLFTTWLVGFNLNDHRPGVEIGETGYIAEIKKLAISVDHALMEKIGRKDGAVLAIELEVADLTVGSKSVRAFDVNNDHLGLIGMDNVTLKMKDESPPIRLRIPFFVRINPNTKALEFENLGIKTNLKDADFGLEYKNLVVPEMALIVNNKRYDLNTGTLNTEIRNSLPKVIDTLLNHMDEFAQTELPKILNQKAQEMVIGALEQVNFMDPPGAEANDPKGPFRWGLQANRISLGKDLDIALNAFVEDPFNNDTAPIALNGSRAKPNLNAVSSTTYDFAMSLDRGFVNRILQLSFERGLFSKINSCDGSDPLTLTGVPAVDSVYLNSYTQQITPLSTYIRMKTRSRHETKSFKERLVLKSPFEIEADVFAKLTYDPQKGVVVTLESFDYNSLKLDSKYLKAVGRMLDNTVLDGVRDEMKNIEKSWKQVKRCKDGSDSNVVGSIPLSMPLGLPVKPQQLFMDPNGHLLIYLNLGGAK